MIDKGELRDQLEQSMGYNAMWRLPGSVNVAIWVSKL